MKQETIENNLKFLADNDTALYNLNNEQKKKIKKLKKRIKILSTEQDRIDQRCTELEIDLKNLTYKIKNNTKE